MTAFADYQTVKVRNGTAKIGDLVRIWDTGEEGTVSRITRMKPIRANRTMVELTDSDGIWLNDVNASRLELVNH